MDRREMMPDRDPEGVGARLSLLALCLDIGALVAAVRLARFVSTRTVPEVPVLSAAVVLSLAGTVTAVIALVRDRSRMAILALVLGLLLLVPSAIVAGWLVLVIIAIERTGITL